MIEIKEVIEEKISDTITRLHWLGENEFGHITVFYAGIGNYKIDAEFVDLETIAAIFKVWIETKS